MLLFSAKTFTKKHSPKNQECLQISLDEREAFVQGKAARRRGIEIEIEWHRSIQDSRKFYKRLNDVRRPFEPQVAKCQAKNEELLTSKNQMLARWKEHFEENLNEGSESEEPTRPVDLGDDIDLPSLVRK
jgi:hypothetical protein